MNKLEYKIVYDEKNIPYIELKENHSLSNEDKFMVVEVCRVMLLKMRREIDTANKMNISKSALNNLISTYDFMELLSIQMGSMLENMNDSLNELKDILNKDNNDEQKEAN